jgi:hypothetical protein
VGYTPEGILFDIIVPKNAMAHSGALNPIIFTDLRYSTPSLIVL